MKRKLPFPIIIYLFLSNCFLLAVIFAQPKEGPTKNSSVYLIKRVDTPPQIDGKLDDICWKKVHFISEFTLLNIEKQELAQEQTKGYLVYDDNNLYIGVECLESNTKRLKAIHRERDSNIWEDDCVEIFIDTNNDGKTYYHFITNSLGTQFDARGLDKSWNGDWKVKTSIGEKSWLVEMSIPFTTLNTKPKKGELWRFNLCRERYAGSVIELSAWSNTGESFHIPERFGYLVFQSFEEQLRKDLNALKIKKEEIAKLLKSNAETEEFEGKFEKICEGFGKIKKSLESFSESSLSEEKWFYFYLQLKELLNRCEELKFELEFSALIR